MNKIYTMGYGDPSSVGRLQHLMSNDSTLLIDVRKSPRTGYIMWNGETLARAWGKRYRQAGQFLGNINYKGGPIQIADMETGVKGLISYYTQGHDLILLCGCKNYDTCHRHTIIDYLRKEYPLLPIAPEQEPIIHAN